MTVHRIPTIPDRFKKGKKRDHAEHCKVAAGAEAVQLYVSQGPRLADLGIDSALVESITRAQEPFVKVFPVTQNKADLLSDK